MEAPYPTGFLSLTFTTVKPSFQTVSLCLSPLQKIWHCFLTTWCTWVAILWSKMTDQNLNGKLFLLHNMNITSVSGNICSRMWEKSEHELNKNSDVTVLMTQRSSTSCTTWSENEVLKLELLYSCGAEHILLPFVLKTYCDSCLSFVCIKCWAALITGACFASCTLHFCFTGFQLFFTWCNSLCLM